VTGRTHRKFRKHFDALPDAVRKLAREKFGLWKGDPHHPHSGSTDAATTFASFELAIITAPSACAKVT